MISADYHIHSYFSGDSEECFEQIVSASVAAGLQEICVTDHQDFGFVAEEVLYELKAETYYETISQIARKYAGTLTIKKGVETGLEADKAGLLADFVNSQPFDFVIGSVHLIGGCDPYYPTFFEGKSDEQAFTEYFEAILAALEVCSDFDVFGHLDYIVRYSPRKASNYSYEKYRGLIDAVLERLIHMGKGIEVNTCGYRAGLGFPNPCKDILNRYREMGGEILTVGSDAHVAKDIGSYFTEVEALLSECGFRYYTVYDKRIPDFIKI